MTSSSDVWRFFGIAGLHYHLYVNLRSLQTAASGACESDAMGISEVRHGLSHKPPNCLIMVPTLILAALENAHFCAFLVLLHRSMLRHGTRHTSWIELKVVHFHLLSALSLSLCKPLSKWVFFSGSASNLQTSVRKGVRFPLRLPPKGLAAKCRYYIFTRILWRLFWNMGLRCLLLLRVGSAKSRVLRYLPEECDPLLVP
ncbi:hypothetical protein DFJ77DRAFT_69604 [Powellomyces hirtus]|nr:hypothetical protein DFJ77DRAFT_69604 [Powellomyces hirtus]